MAGWLAREVKSILPNNGRVYAGPHVAGGMTMPSELIRDEIIKITKQVIITVGSTLENHNG